MSALTSQEKAIALFTRAALNGMRNDVRLEPFLLAELLGYDVQDFHHVWLDTLANNKKTVIIAPPGHGKSTIGAIIFTLWKVVRDPNSRILIVSGSNDQAGGLLHQITKIIEDHRGFRALFGGIVPRHRHDTELAVRRESTSTKAGITASGAGCSLAGRGFDVVIADDIVDDENSSRSTERMRLRAWFEETLLPSIGPDGELHLIGTRRHADDLYGEIMRLNAESGGPYKVVVDTALEGGQALWPGRFSLRRLRQIRREIGPGTFERRYNNNP